MGQYACPADPVGPRRTRWARSPRASSIPLSLHLNPRRKLESSIASRSMSELVDPFRAEPAAAVVVRLPLAWSYPP